MNQRETVISLLYKARQLFVKKNKDYASDENAFSNFEFTGMVLDWAIKYGVCGADLAFIALLSTKMARMIELRGSGKDPENEPIEDTCIDQAVYSALWGGWILTRDLSVYELAAQADANLKAGVPTLSHEEVFDEEMADLDLEAAKEARDCEDMREAMGGMWMAPKHD